MWLGVVLRPRPENMQQLTDALEAVQKSAGVDKKVFLRSYEPELENSEPGFLVQYENIQGLCEG